MTNGQAEAELVEVVAVVAAIAFDKWFLNLPKDSGGGHYQKTFAQVLNEQ